MSLYNSALFVTERYICGFYFIFKQHSGLINAIHETLRGFILFGCGGLYRAAYNHSPSVGKKSPRSRRPNNQRMLLQYKFVWLMLASTPLYSLSTFPLCLSTKNKKKTNNAKVRKIPGFIETIQNTKTIQDEDHDVRQTGSETL